MADAGAAEVIDDAELSAPLLAARVDGLFGDRERLATMAASSATLAMPGAAGAIADEVLAAAAGAPHATPEDVKRTDG
jgi:UDP-N-acetylglucosamine:LPS N-acetylglucosamine transferase